MTVAIRIRSSKTRRDHIINDHIRQTFILKAVSNWVKEKRVEGTSRTLRLNDNRRLRDDIFRKRRNGCTLQKK